MLNLYALNSKVIGPGVPPLYSRGVGAQTLRLIGALTTGIIKYGKAAGSLSIVGTLTPEHRIAAAMDGMMSMTGVAYGYVKTYVFGASSAVLRIVGDASSSVRRYFAGSQILRLSHSATPRKLTAIHASGNITFLMATSNAGSDYYTGDAPEERTTGVVDLDTQTAPFVEIGA